MLKLTAYNSENEQAEEELEATTQGEGFKISFNVAYLLDVLTHISPGEVQLSFSTPDHSILIQSLNDEACQYVIMPMKI